MQLFLPAVYTTPSALPVTALHTHASMSSDKNGVLQAIASCREQGIRATDHKKIAAVVIEALRQNAKPFTTTTVQGLVNSVALSLDGAEELVELISEQVHKRNTAALSK